MMGWSCKGVFSFTLSYLSLSLSIPLFLFRRGEEAPRVPVDLFLAGGPMGWLVLHREVSQMMHQRLFEPCNLLPSAQGSKKRRLADRLFSDT